MRAIRFLICTILLANLVGVGLAGVPQRRSIYGRVIDPSDTPVEKVEVTAQNVSTREKKSTSTDGQGRYDFADLPEGDYRLTFRRDGFQRGERQVSVRAPIIPLEVNKKLRIAPTLAAGGLNGVVEDESGAVVPGAEVTAVNVQTGLQRKTVTDEDGFYHIEVPAGTYGLEIRAIGFKKYEVADVKVESTQAANVEVALSAGSISEVASVEITADAPLIEEQAPINTTVVSGRNVEDLPLPQRNFVLLATLSPGVSRPVIRENQTDSAGGINGSQGRAVTFQVDGAVNDDLGATTGLIVDRVPVLPFGSIREVTIAEPFSAEVGRSAGGIINVVTAGGSNEFHGSAFYFHRNSSLDARDFFEIKKAPARGHQFGFTVGGPIVKYRTFFFGGYEGNREFQARPRLVSVPSSSRLASARALLAVGELLENPLSTRLLQFFPTPDRPGSFHNLAINSPAVNDSDALQVRLDHFFGEQHTALLRYNFSRSEQLLPLAQSFFPGYRAHYSGREQTLSALLTSSLTVTRLNEVIFSYRRNKYRVSPEDHAFNPAAIGLETGVIDPERFGLPLIKITGFDALGAPSSLPGREAATAWQLKDLYVQLLNQTTIKAGVDFRQVLSDSLNEAGTRGRIFFDGSVLGDPLADFLAGLPAGDTGILRGDTRREIALKYFSWFVQAEMKPHSRLAFNAGLRYEFNGLPDEERDRLSNFVPELGGLLAVGSHQLPKLYRNDLNNFAPRLSFAWSLTRSQSVFLRGGWGVFYVAPTPRLFASICPCPNSISQGVTTNPAGPSPVFAVRPSGSIPFGPGQSVFGVGPVSNAPLDIQAVERHLKTPIIQNFNVGLQSEFVWRILLELTYQGSVGAHLYRTFDINQPTPGDTLTRDGRRPFFATFPQFRSINLLSSSARSSYHSMMLSAKRRMSEGLWFEAGYNLSKTVDDASDASEIPQNSRDLRSEHALSSFDRRHRFALTWIYKLPQIGPEVLNGWQVSGIFRAESGRPFTPLISFDNSGTATFVDRPSLIGKPRLHGSRTWLYDLSAFQIPLRGTFGNLGRNSLVGPGFNNLDVSLMKKTKLWRDTALELRFDFFNLLNHPNFRMPNQLVDEPAFGRVNATEVHGGRRRIQIGVRLLF